MKHRLLIIILFNKPGRLLKENMIVNTEPSLR